MPFMISTRCSIYHCANGRSAKYIQQLLFLPHEWCVCTWLKWGGPPWAFVNDLSKDERGRSKIETFKMYFLQRAPRTFNFGWNNIYIKRRSGFITSLHPYRCSQKKVHYRPSFILQKIYHKFWQYYITSHWPYKENIPFNWNPLYHVSSDTIKIALTNNPILISPEPYIVSRNASKHNFSRVLTNINGRYEWMFLILFDFM